MSYWCFGLGLREAPSCSFITSTDWHRHCTRGRKCSVWIEKKRSSRTLWLHYATPSGRIIEKRKLKLSSWKTLVPSVQANGLNIPHKGVPFCRGRLSSNTEGAGSQDSGWVLQMVRPKTSPSFLPEMSECGGGDQDWQLRKFTTLAFWLEMYSAF